MDYNIEVTAARRALERLKGARAAAARRAQELGDDAERLRLELARHEEARAVVQEVAQLTQRELEYHVSELVSMALAAVFDDPYRLALRFVQRRNKTEADLLFLRGGDEIDPIGSAGGGPVDVAAFALRVAVWSLRRPRTRAVLVLDEPFRFLSRDLQGRASQMLAEISRRLGLQIVMVSHSPDLIEGADKAFAVSMREGVSRVEEA